MPIDREGDGPHRIAAAHARDARRAADGAAGGAAPPARRAACRDEEFLLRATMPAGQVDAMLAAGPAPRQYDPALQTGARADPRAVGTAATSTDVLRREAGLQAGAAPAVRDAVLPQLKGFMFDLDGTLVLSDRSGGYEVLPGAVEVLTRLARARHPVRRAHQRQRLSAGGAGRQAARLGLPVRRRQMLTPSSVTAELMARAGVQRALVLGSPGSVTRLQRARHRNHLPRRTATASEVEAVYVGWHPDCNMKDIEAACNAIWAGAQAVRGLRRAVLRHQAGPHHGLFLCDRRRHSPHDQGAHDSPASRRCTRCASWRGDSGCGAPDIGVVGDDPVGRNHHGATRRRHGFRRDDGSHDNRTVAATDRPAAPRSCTAATRRSAGMRALTLLAAVLFATLPGVQTAAQPSKAVDNAALGNEADGTDWPAYGRTFGESRFSPLRQVNDSNVSRLRLAWWLDLDVTNSITAPVEAGGVDLSRGRL